MTRVVAAKRKIPKSRTAQTRDAKPIVPAATRARIRRTLLRWYDSNKRDLPWRRRQHDPYAQWVAEIMLQQTRVDTVRAYYERFLHRFPDVAALASAKHQTVLKHWEGLGYYRRALNLHEAARQLSANGSAIPTTATELRSLPGIGTYTAAAIASIAYGEHIAAVDGNVARVVARLFGVSDDVLLPVGRRRVERIATELVPPNRPGDFNQAWMDLGSTICTPTTPACESCPLRRQCVAEQTGLIHSLPVRRGGKRLVRGVSMVVGVFQHRGKTLVRQRPKGGLWSGLWEFPQSETKAERIGASSIKDIALQCGLTLTGRVQQASTVQHRLTHRAMTFHIYVATVRSAAEVEEAGVKLRWVDKRGLARVAMSTAHRKVQEATSRIEANEVQDKAVFQ